MRGGGGRLPAGCNTETGHTGQGFGVRQGVELVENAVELIHVHLSYIDLVVLS